MNTNNQVMSGTLGGSLCSIWANFALGDVLHTLLMAVMGTVVSYLLSEQLHKRKKQDE
ncbi:hypothetical protein ORI89_08250 [Sphingobacterium sp. UT-1RO-CII-1]|uniref:hypothetical protein n=1 Tax=Sphingobacterium sp. UT-1RO-CII-1 TaxID=2995225 RepID=UPI00227B802B|nr:hypothetical protein [Sphingobacterium sp. UT-1RO-CII-1]MCY4778554.1 hypothetical protein [Sphingobacterium sp. UT-1RO-CII-1]MCY4779640.1 hypothetical protein [Sphingobacterium sp. UT-1RO-CII-1]